MGLSIRKTKTIRIIILIFYKKYNIGLDLFSVLTIFIFTLTKRISIEFNRLKNCGSNEDVGTKKKS
jgi:hypothetical protein